MPLPTLDDRLVLVGGTGRSGSTIVGHLLDHHPDLVLSRPMEVRFLAGNDGFVEALHIWTHLKAGKPAQVARAVEASELAVDRLLNRWFERAENVGLHQSMSIDDVRVWAAEYLDTVGKDPIAATRTLSDRILSRIARRLEASRLVDTTPANARNADRIEPVYPASKVVMVTRDGRDVAASFVSQAFGPDDVFVALDQWEKRMLRSHRAAQASRPDRIMTIELMDLVVRDRVGGLRELCEFLEVPVDSQMVDWFDAHVTADGAHPGRWRQDFDIDQCARIDAHYQEACDRLRAEGVAIPAP